MLLVRVLPGTYMTWYAYVYTCGNTKVWYICSLVWQGSSSEHIYFAEVITWNIYMLTRTGIETHTYTHTHIHTYIRATIHNAHKVNTQIRIVCTHICTHYPLTNEFREQTRMCVLTYIRTYAHILSHTLADTKMYLQKRIIECVYIHTCIMYVYIYICI